MKKVTIITPPEYEGLVLESLGQSRVVELTHVTGSEFESLEAPEAQTVDYKELRQRVRTRLIEPLGLNENDLEWVTPSVDELRDFARDPVGKVDALIAEAESLVTKIKDAQDGVNAQKNKLVSELDEKLKAGEDDLNDAKHQLVEKLDGILAEKESKTKEIASLKTRLGYLMALKPEDLEGTAVGVVKSEFIPQLESYLKRYPETSSKITGIADDASVVVVKGGDETKEWASSLFLVYDVTEINDILDKKDLKAAKDGAKRDKTISKIQEELAKLEKAKVSEESKEEKDLKVKISSIDSEYEKSAADLKEEYESKIKKLEESAAEPTDQEEQKAALGNIGYYARVLKTYSKKNAPVLRGKVISVLQGYSPDASIPGLETAVAKVEEQIGEKLYLEVSELDAGDHHAPVPEADFKSKTLQPLWILTRLRGWPSAEEFNPGYLSVLIFCFQFGLMYGDIGQGLVFLTIGLVLRKKFLDQRGMNKYLFSLFIPMGIAAIIFGFAYDSIFLYEHEITHWLEHSLHWVGNFDSHHHLLNVDTPFGFTYPIMPNPMSQTGDLMNLIFKIGAIEIVFGSMLGAYNAFKAKNYAGMIGEHGAGMGLYVIGLYFSAATMFTEGLDIMAVVAGFPFKLMLLGMGLSFIEPILHSLMHGHGIGGMESIGQGIGGLLLTFVEGLANMFSFLRVAAFAIAHVSLSGAGEAMGHAIDNPLAGMIIMNIIALTFEFVSSSVQSIRLLYYEFMGKFFHGEGKMYKPFTLPALKTKTE